MKVDGEDESGRRMKVVGGGRNGRWGVGMGTELEKRKYFDNYRCDLIIEICRGKLLLSILGLNVKGHKSVSV